jgi:hypothetical protein
MTISQAIIELAINAKHGGIKQIAEEYNVNYHTLRKEVSKYERSVLCPQEGEGLEPLSSQARDTLTGIAKLGPVPQSVNIVKPPLHLHERKWAYASDFHCPMQDERWVERLAKVGYHLEIPTLIVGGDVADFDSISAHGSDIEQHDINTAVEVAGQVIRYLKGVFERIVLLPGNHDRRLAKKLDKNLSWENVVRMMVGNMDGIMATDDDYVLVGDKPGFSCGHPRHFSAKPTGGLHSVALYRQRNVIAAHNHVQGLAIVNNQYVTIDPGCMCRAEATPYYMRSNGLSKFQEWTPGFVTVEDNIPTLFGEFITRWSDYR